MTGAPPIHLDREMHQVRKADRVVVGIAAAVAAAWLAGCGAAARPSPGTTEGATSPETAVETFLAAAQDAILSRQAGEFTAADRGYEKMTSVFGTENGSISRAFSAEDVRSRMIVLSACLRPRSYSVTSTPDPQAWENKRTTVSIVLTRDVGDSRLAFSLVLGRGDRWFIERIDLSEFAC